MTQSTKATEQAMMHAQTHDTTPSNHPAPRAEPRNLGKTGLDIWKAWRSMPWQGIGVYGNALCVGEFTWQADGNLYRVLDGCLVRRASQAEEEEVWKCLLDGCLRIYSRRGRERFSSSPVHIYHEMTGCPVPSGVL